MRAVFKRAAGRARRYGLPRRYGLHGGAISPPPRALRRRTTRAGGARRPKRSGKPISRGVLLAVPNLPTTTPAALLAQ
jgi:hypothetical protein